MCELPLPGSRPLAAHLTYAGHLRSGWAQPDGSQSSPAGARSGEADLSSSVKPQAYTNEHLDLVRQLNDPFALALTNALRYRELERLHRRLQDDNRQIQLELAQRTGDQVVGSDFGAAWRDATRTTSGPLVQPCVAAG